MENVNRRPNSEQESIDRGGEGSMSGLYLSAMKKLLLLPGLQRLKFQYKLIKMEDATNRLIQDADMQKDQNVESYNEIVLQ